MWQFWVLEGAIILWIDYYELIRINRNTKRIALVSAVLLEPRIDVYDEKGATKKVRELATKIAPLYNIKNWKIKDLGGNYTATVQKGNKKYAINILRSANLDTGEYDIGITVANADALLR